VRADYAAARADCERLKPLTTELIGFACGTSLDALTGKARQSYDALADMLAKHARSRPEERLWVVIRLAEMAERVGDHEAAERRFKQALFIDPRDQYLLAAYADFLLDQNRGMEVVSLLKQRTNAEHLLLRLALAEKQLGSAQFEQHRSMVEEAFASARRDGHPVHEQEEARFALQVQGDSERALKLAVSNWQVQRETRDARVLLEAALAAGHAGAAGPVLTWMRESGIEDVRLRGLAGRLEQREASL
jgi:Tfp pilus assembly protein PilF